ncbi:sn-glycerol-3-phosphate ABC transporter ATP-binding protein UgpC [Pseudaminobacter sp. 19-2017]|uniref:Sn-glycerol-3-phosphate ABC transporter ATP-binding protein UgpC n=1 Tax=Pseudaminobacter soli (ex Zhang et al. 2022) TaxID=2831468 RepID=A0A942E3Z7_9HYPH|nr:sn-glycerol-3-phosphate ABC transporter ATP-binding protein UgpC [Pseudaminobacter soli]MBS3650546.1 sn-glycerol-3-phosphate ABC transporter ATP-binding protein UgpC [Pseudaminobacter soli]
MSEITLRNVRKSYGKNEVVHGVDLDIATGEFIVILGPSGCGKSTLLRMVAGLEAITTGEIEIGGRVVNRLEPRERGCAMVFQNYALYPHMTVAKNIGYSLKIAGIPRAERDKRVQEVAKALGLEEFLERRPAQLSGGQRQRVAMGRAMIRAPKVFLYDEPLSNLDARLRVAMRVEIRKLHQRLSTTTLFVTHDQVEAMTLADRIVVMNKGVVEQVGTPAEVYQKPQTTYVAGFIGTPGMNLIDVTADPDKGVLVLSDGQQIAYDCAQWPDVGYGPVTAGFRAQAVRLEPGCISGKFDFSEELGSAKLVHGTFAGTALIAHVAGARTFTPGEPLCFAVDATDIHLFDADSGRRFNERVRDAPIPGRKAEAIDALIPKVA